MVKKNTNYFKLGILFLSFFFFLWSCEKEDVFVEQQNTFETVSISEAYSLFNIDNKSSVDSKSSNGQYAIPDLDQISQEEIKNSSELLTVIPASLNKDDFYSRILLLKIDGETKSIVFNMLPNDQATAEEFSGSIFIMDLDGNFINGYKIQRNIFVSEYRKAIGNQAKIYTGKLNKSSADDCPYEDNSLCDLEEVVITANFGGPKTSNTPLNIIYFQGGLGTNYTWDPWTGSGGGSPSSSDCSDGYVKDENGNCVADNFEEGCSEGYHKDDLGNCIENPVLSADCRSFEYAQPPGALLKACAVTGLWNTFYAYGTQNGKAGVYEAFVGYPLVYFTAPPSMTNGYAANRTAKAVTEAFRRTDVWFAANPSATKEQVGKKLSSYILNEMGKFGGSMTQIPPFSIPSPAPYLSSLVGTGNCL